ncbi:MAG: (d)CMP kinase, partial [Nitrospinota bacterium]|nr:(d)CMP kinase [Nitrospinota bacterium]
RVLGAGGSTGDLAEILPYLEDFRFECRKAEGGWRNFLDGRDVTQDLREERVSFAASKVSSFTEVRSVLLAYQRSYGIERGAVLDGRDIGTVVFPDAKLKFFLDADIEVRIQRRFDELKRNGISFDPVRLGADLRERDRRDRDREVAPLRPAEDAILLDTSDLPIDRVLAAMLEKVRQVYGEVIEVR